MCTVLPGLSSPIWFRRVLGMMCSRFSQRTWLLLLLLPGTCLLFVSFSATKAIVSTLPQISFQSQRLLQSRNAAISERSNKIILMTYGRSGSSFTSEIIQRHPDVFYTFEPLYNLIRRHIGLELGKRCFIFPNVTREAYDRESISIMEIFLNCAFEIMNSEDINNFQLRNSDDSRLLWECAQQKKNSTPVETMDCFIKARKVCSSRPVRMIKTIRFRGTAAAKMMAKHRDLKILYLTRDPRGTISSQKRVFSNFDRDKLVNFTSNFCQIFREDLVDLEPLFDKYPNRMKLLRYETLAEDPLNVSQEIYAFLGLDFTDDVRTFVYNITSAGHSSKNAYDTSNPNSTEAAYSWRQRITFAEVQTIDRICKDVYKMLGYIPVNYVQELTSWNHSLKTDVFFRGEAVLGA